MIPQNNNALVEELKRQHASDFFEFAGKSKSANSIRAYRFGWLKFEEWCKENGYNPFFPPSGSHEFLVGLFVASMAKKRNLKPNSLSCYLGGIKHFYAEKGLDVDTRHKEIRRAMSGIRRELGAKTNQKTPLLTENIKLLIDSMETPLNNIDMRDKTLILVGFAGAFRRSELVGIDIEHLSFDPCGVTVYLPKSKTDQEGEGRFVDIPFTPTEKYCPVRAIKSWMEHADIEKGPLFLQVRKDGLIVRNRLSPQTVAYVLKKRCEPFGFSTNIAGHSLRSGHVTSSIKNAVPETWIMRQTGHTNINTLKKYERLNREFFANSAARIGL